MTFRFILVSTGPHRRVLTTQFRNFFNIHQLKDYLFQDPHDIIFTCDLHLEIPSSLIYSIRKVSGKLFAHHNTRKFDGILHKKLFIVFWS